MRVIQFFRNVAECSLFACAIALVAASAQSAPQAAQPSAVDQSTGINWRTAVSDMPPEPASDSERATRQARSARFDDRSGTRQPLDSPDAPEVHEGMSIYYAKIDPLPASLSDAVVVGTVVRFQPFFSSDRTSIYTELTVRVEKVFKDPADAVRRRIVIDELGGAIRLPDGRVARKISAPLDSQIDVGHRYVLFLRNVGGTDGFSVVKAWELRNGRARPVAKSDLNKEALETTTPKYAGMSEADFLGAVQEAASK